MGCFECIQQLVITSVFLIGICANIGWCWLAISKYLDYERLNLIIQIPLHAVTLTLFNFGLYRLACQMAKDQPQIFSVYKELFRGAFCWRQNKALRNRAYELNHNFNDGGASGQVDKCAICWSHFAHERSQHLLKCGHRFHAHCLETYEESDAGKLAYFRCPTCRQLYHRKTRWSFQYAFHLLHA